MAKDGKYFESIVKLFENSYNPNARITHDVQMPILNSRNNATTQCDIVIITGEKPRESITLVEVQDRGSKVKPNDFRGWLKKVEEVGAQHLICVSRQNFPESIKESAANSGNLVRLINLKEDTFDSLPNNFINQNFIEYNFDITKVETINLTTSRSEFIKNNLPENFEIDFKQINLNDKVFSLDEKNLFSLEQICRNLPEINKEIKDGFAVLSHPIKTSNFFIFVEGKMIKIGLEIGFRYKSSIKTYPITLFSYDQLEHGVLGWILEGKAALALGEGWFRIPLILEKDNYRIADIDLKLPPNTDFTITFN